ncbi:hypothetical protein V8E54_010550 [Elaphomyces granulatus]
MTTLDTTRDPSINKHDFTSNDYTVGWICAFEIELAASQAMLDEVYPDLLQDEKDSNTYTLGRIGQHNVVLACLPSGTTGTDAAATAAKDLLRSFPKIRFGLMVGVGGGAPGHPSDDPNEDLHLGDVVVSNPESGHGGVVQYDFGKTMEEGKFIKTRSLDKPPTAVRSAVSKLRARHESEGSAIGEYISKMLESKPMMRKKFKYQGIELDQLFDADYDHRNSGRGCESCDKGHLLTRGSRDRSDPIIHYGLIGSANQVMRHGATRKKLRREEGILCFEMEAAGLMDNFPCLVIRGICDYSDTHKNKYWQPYAAAVAAAYAKELLEIIPPAQVDRTLAAADRIKDVSEKMNKIGEDVGSINKNMNSLCSAQEGEHRKRLLDWLSPIDYAKLQSDILCKRQEGTGKWFLKTTAFIEWVEEKQNTLFCPGIPGAGKTMIASIVVDYLKTSFPDGETGIAFLYCIYKRRDNQEVDGLLASLLGQLAAWQPIIPESVRKLYDKHLTGGKPRPSRDEIREGLHCIIQAYSRIFIVIDALDECKTDPIRDKLLSEVYELQEGCDIRLMLTFRPNIVPKAPSSGSVTTLEIRAYEEDIERYLSSQMSQLPRIVQDRNELQRKIKTRIITLVDGILSRFLLAQLYINSLTDKLREKEIDSTLDNMRKGEEGLNKAYDDTINRIGNQQQGFRDLAKRVLLWIVCAKRPLTTGELRHALAVEPGTSSLDMRSLYTLKDIVSSCLGLVTVDQDSNIIRLVHYTTQEYFQRTGLENFPDVQRDVITTSCLTYLSFNVFAEGCCLNDEILKTRLQQYPFFNYAAQNWAYHFEDTQQSAGDLALKFLMDDSKTATSSQVLFPSQGFFQRPPKQFCGMHLVAYFGSKDIMMRLLREKAPDAKDSNGRTPLSYAAERGNEVVVNLLLNRNVDPNSKCADGWTPLSRAIERGSAAIVQLLLAQRVEIDYNYNITPLSRAAEKGDETVAELLLKYGAQPDLEDKDGWKPLSRAVERGSAAIVQLLLAQGVKMDYNYNITPLSRAIEKWDEIIVELLLKYGAQPDLEDSGGQAPLSRAICAGNTVLVQLLNSYLHHECGLEPR